ncbi:hypothetical protein DRF60_13255 [Chryseobacterium elymi]|uniref:Aldehyde dehydrogenase domain-containing protein n=1 Tax=Chryseobacterium elymi TaxID=395936 RepID=A0A3D9DFQ7_9FLAO|nr:hypothetical protein [Chryseobacterium elymi]REC76844.1 hypothetical protein DRF60_13255 [Chryseobacterium elymi]
MRKQIKNNFDKLFIGGEWLSSENGKTLEVKNPHDLSIVGTFPLASKGYMDFSNIGKYNITTAKLHQ